MMLLPLSYIHVVLWKLWSYRNALQCLQSNSGSVGSGYSNTTNTNNTTNPTDASNPSALASARAPLSSSSSNHTPYYLPPSSSYYSTNKPSTAVFYTSILYTKTKSVHNAYLYAKALCYNNEYRRAISILDYAGLLNFYSLALSFWLELLLEAGQRQWQM